MTASNFSGPVDSPRSGSRCECGCGCMAMTAATTGAPVALGAATTAATAPLAAPVTSGGRLHIVPLAVGQHVGRRWLWNSFGS